MRECPYCNKDIENFIYDEWIGDYWEYIDDFVCPYCDKEMIVEVESSPSFILQTKEVK